MIEILNEVVKFGFLFAIVGLLWLLFVGFAVALWKIARDGEI